MHSAALTVAVVVAVARAGRAGMAAVRGGLPSLTACTLPATPWANACAAPAWARRRRQVAQRQRQRQRRRQRQPPPQLQPRPPPRRCAPHPWPPAHPTLLPTLRWRLPCMAHDPCLPHAGGIVQAAAWSPAPLPLQRRLHRRRKAPRRVRRRPVWQPRRSRARWWVRRLAAPLPSGVALVAPQKMLLSVPRQQPPLLPRRHPPPRRLPHVRRAGLRGRRVARLAAPASPLLPDLAQEQAQAQAPALGPHAGR